jgi:hypothetical protein
MDPSGSSNATMREDEPPGEKRRATSSEQLSNSRWTRRQLARVVMAARDHEIIPLRNTNYTILRLHPSPTRSRGRPH